MFTTELQSKASIDEQLAKVEAEIRIMKAVTARLDELIALAKALPDKPTTNEQIKTVTTEVNDFCELMGC